MHLFLELFTLGAFVATGVHLARRRGPAGAWLYGALIWLGLVRESVVVAWRVLYELAPLTLELGRVPVIAMVIWAFSITAAVAWAEETTARGRRLHAGAVAPSLMLGAVLFMAVLPGFYEPFLERVGMARWEAGTRTTFGVPWIAVVGYATLTAAFLLLWGPLMRIAGARRRALAMALGVGTLAAAHAWGLAVLKGWLGW